MTPEVPFDVVGAPNQSSAYATAVLSEAKEVANVTLHGGLSAVPLSHLYRSRRVLGCTSELEGFPATFPEAWSCGVPVITTFDPDGVVGRNGLGLSVSTAAEMAEAIRELHANADEYRKISDIVSEYYLAHHSVEGVAENFAKVFRDLGSEGRINLPTVGPFDARREDALAEEES